MADIFETIYSSYKIPVFNYLCRCTANRSTAEELTQETFLRAFKFFNGFRGESSTKTWIFKIARNVYLDFQRRECEWAIINEDQVSDRKDAYAEVDEKLLISKVLNRLGEQERAIIIFRDINGMKYSEIARIMELSQGQVKIGLYRARKKFKTMYLYANREEI